MYCVHIKDNDVFLLILRSFLLLSLNANKILAGGDFTESASKNHLIRLLEALNMNL